MLEYQEPSGNVLVVPSEYMSAVYCRGASWLTSSGVHARFQSDGNFVLYSRTGTPLWSSQTYEGPGAFLAIRASGQMEIYDASGRPLWSVGAKSANGAYLAIQQDGNLVLYDAANAVLWASQTQDSGAD